MKQYAQINRMMISKNADAFEALLAPDFYEIDQTGKKLSRDEFIKNEVDPIKGADKVTSHVHVTKISQHGDDAEVSYDWKYTVTVGTTKVSGHEVGTDGWHKTSDKWLNTYTKLKSATEKTTTIKPHKKK